MKLPAATKPSNVHTFAVKVCSEGVWPKRVDVGVASCIFFYSLIAVLGILELTHRDRVMTIENAVNIYYIR